MTADSYNFPPFSESQAHLNINKIEIDLPHLLFFVPTKGTQPSFPTVCYLFLVSNCDVGRRRLCAYHSHFFHKWLQFSQTAQRAINIRPSSPFLFDLLQVAIKIRSWFPRLVLQIISQCETTFINTKLTDRNVNGRRNGGAASDQRLDKPHFA